jgi:hypothetical protein
MRATFVLSALLLCGCAAPHKTAKPIAPAQVSVFDQALANPKYMNAIRQAERDLPGDTKVEKPFPANLSRERREYQVATNILAELEPKLKRMTATRLVHSLKVEGVPSAVETHSLGGVADFVYVGGYALIKREIQSRPEHELWVLSGLADDSVWLYTGPQGPPVTLADFVQREVYGK